MTLTEKEVAALRLCLNYSERESQLSDNFSNGGPVEFANALFDGNLRAAGGLISSLEKKGLGWLDDRTGDMECSYDRNMRPRKPLVSEHIFWLTDEGVNAVFDIAESK